MKGPKAAVAMLKKFGAYDDVEKVISSKTLRAGKGKMRNRRFVQRRGPLVVRRPGLGVLVPAEGRGDRDLARSTRGGGRATRRAGCGEGTAGTRRSPMGWFGMGCRIPRGTWRFYG